MQRRRIKTETGFITKAAKAEYHHGNYSIQRDKLGNYYLKKISLLFFFKVSE